MRLTLLLVAVACSLPLACLGSSPCMAADAQFRDFSLPSASGETVTLSRDPSVQLHVLCFLGTECPLARVYGPRLQKMSEEFSERGVQFIGVISNVQDSMEDVQRYVSEHSIGFPVARDYDGQLAQSAGATRTPEIFVLDRSGAIVYQGRIDDQYQPGVMRNEATQHDLRDAVNALLAGQSPKQSHTQAVGCLIGRARQEPTDFSVTYCNQIARILDQHCVECHRKGEIGPFVLDDFDEVVGWADMSLEVIDQGRMPPWHASPEHGQFANSRFMPDEDKLALQRWVSAGMPYGDPKDLPPPKELVTGWRLPREPDVVLSMSDRPFAIPAEGTVEYQYFVVDPGFTEDKWVSAAEVIPGNRGVVHHCIAFTRPPDGSSFREIGLLSAYVPGQIRSPLPEGYAQKVPAGSRIVFQMHYTPSGKPEEDVTKIGLVLSDPQSVTHEVIALGGVQQEFEIPPGAEQHVVDGKISWFPSDGKLLAIMPHMHLRGKSYEFRAVRDDGQPETLLKVPHYDFNWQHNYEFTSPLSLTDVKELEFSAVFDNSTHNPSNPDPNELVTWGDQTWQEMAVTFLAVARPIDSPEPTASEPATEQELAQQAEQRAKNEQKATEFASEYLQRFDKNEDGVLTSHELPHSVRMFSYWQLDHNGDEQITKDEIYQSALSRFENP